MASVQALSAATQDRKSRLAQLKSLKRKAPDEPADDSFAHSPTPKSPRHDTASSEIPPTQQATPSYLSGRNYDSTTQGPRLGFENAPSEGQETLEAKAAALAVETKAQAAAEAEADQPLDLFKLQPKKPNWDLKRDLERKMEVLNVRTDNAIARLVRERVAEQQRAARGKGAGEDVEAEGEAAGLDGAALVEATHVREREDEEEARREREEERELVEGT